MENHPANEPQGRAYPLGFATRNGFVWATILSNTKFVLRRPRCVHRGVYHQCVLSLSLSLTKHTYAGSAFQPEGSLFTSRGECIQRGVLPPPDILLPLGALKWARGDVGLKPSAAARPHVQPQYLIYTRMQVQSYLSM